LSVTEDPCLQPLEGRITLVHKVSELTRFSVHELHLLDSQQLSTLSKLDQSLDGLKSHSKFNLNRNGSKRMFREMAPTSS
jgi:hypothetical protein